MSLGLRLDLRQTQNIVLTPQLQLAIRMLQLSNLELARAIEKEVSENPFLDAVSKYGPESSMEDVEARSRSDSGSNPQKDNGLEPDEGWHNTDSPKADEYRISITGASNPRRDHHQTLDAEWQFTQPRTLVDYLQEQLAVLAMRAEEREVLRILLGYLDEDGFIRETDQELSVAIGVDVETIAGCRDAICQCDPSGVGSQNLRGCLKLQLMERGRLDPAMACLIDNLDLVARADLTQLGALCGVDESDLQEMIMELKALDPRPGRNFTDTEPATVIPDLYVVPTRDGWFIRLNSTTLPKVIVDREYYTSVRRSGLVQKDRDYLSERLQSANWLVKALDQRAQTMIRVGRAIFERQKPFLKQGPAGLQPLVLKQIAEATSLHESTVSRATADKYVATPHGTLPLKYFFSTAIADISGQAIHSAEAIRQQIKRMIEQETSYHVLSDDQIVDRLRLRGVVLARRTVAKYREAMGIGSSVQRRRARALERQFAELN